MEARKITIIESRTQKTSVIMSAATTLGELKADLDAKGIDYTDQTFMEGLTKTEFVSNESLLPRDVHRVNRRTGEQTVTNELVFLLTNTQKKIKSGMTRAEAYKYIADHDLKDHVKNIYGKNFTQVSTNELEKFINSTKTAPSCHNCSAGLETIMVIADAMFNSGLLNDEEYVLLNEVFSKCHGCKHGDTKSSYSEEEIQDMFEGLL